MNIQFIEEGHRYTIDGTQVPSVTQVLKALESYDGYPPEAALRGTYVHKIIELYENGTLDPDSVDPALQPYFDAWLKFKAENPLQLDFLSLKYEVLVGSKRLGFAGRVDMLSDDFLIDIKTGAKTRTHPHQLEAYNFAAIEAHGGKRRAMYSLYLSDDGSYRERRYNKTTADGSEAWSMFVSALNVTNFLNGGKIE